MTKVFLQKHGETANITYQTEINTQITFNSMVAELERTIETQIEDEQGNIIWVPEGFKIAEDSGDTVQQGIVIEDVSASGDTAVQGSQFVWIPVGTFIKDDGTQSNEIVLGRYIFGDSTSKGEPALVQAAYTEEDSENYLKHGDTEIISSYYTELPEYREGVASRGLDGLNATAKDLAAFVSSVRTNGGYYIGRYEASFASGDSIGNYKAASKVSTGYSTSSMSYTEGTLWNLITQIEASKVAINTYSGSSSVTSDLMNSYAWDTAIIYIQEAGNENYANKEGYSINSQLTNTGTKQDEVCKINDMASNIREWTTEYSSYADTSLALPCTPRGGSYFSSDYLTASRGYGRATSRDSYLGFRFSLYM